ncbi:MAG: hypothetical protein GX649_16010, partial [Chloroflexi bacterium]|nr:hypothetical protein [Chloroflexota bacterium]
RLGPERLRGAYIVHGEEEAGLALKKGLEDLGVRGVTIPVEGQAETL